MEKTPDVPAGPRWVPSLVAALAVLLGLVNIVSAITPELRSRLRALGEVVPMPVAHVASAATVVAGILLVMLGHGLRRRKHRAWVAALVLLCASAVLHVGKGLDVEEAAVSVALAVGMVALRRYFHAEGDPRTRWRALGTFVVLVLTSFLVGLAMLWARSGDIAGTASFGDRLREVAYGLVGVSGPVHFTVDRVADLEGDVLLGLGIVTGLVTAYLLLRPAEPAPALSEDDERGLRALVEQAGERDSLAYFALRRDRSAVFSATGKAAVSYRVVSGVMLAAGDPLGDPEAWPGAIAAFLAEAARHAWVPAVMGCSEQGGEVWVREAGLQALELGDEAVVDVADFTLEGRAMRNVRQMVNRVDRHGYQTQVRRIGELPRADLEEIRRQADAWRGGEVERGFSMALGRFGEAGDEDCVVATAHRDGRLHAVLHFVPWGRDGLSLDLMRRDRSSDPGLNELLIVRLLQAAPALGVTRVSLNFAVFRSALERGERLGAGPVLRLWRALLVFASRWFQIESLYRFNAKFRPVWEPRFVCYPTARDMPRVALAALEAEAFLVWPRLPVGRPPRVRRPAAAAPR